MKETKSIVYDYLFNYFGGDSYKGKIVLSASVHIAIRVYKNGEEIKFLEEPQYKNKYLCDIYDVSFDREKLFVIHKNIPIDNAFRLAFGWNKIEAEVVGYDLGCVCPMPEEMRKIMKELPKELREMPCTEPVEISEEEFQQFLRERLDDFDISDNRIAQVPSVSYI